VVKVSQYILDSTVIWLLAMNICSMKQTGNCSIKPTFQLHAASLACNSIGGRQPAPALGLVDHRGGVQIEGCSMHFLLLYRDDCNVGSLN